MDERKSDKPDDKPEVVLDQDRRRAARLAAAQEHERKLRDEPCS